MESLKALYKIGPGPSSSHTIGPSEAAKYFKHKYSNVTRYEVTLFGSLALTGKGHLTDYIIEKELKPTQVKIVFDPHFKKYHPNAMEFRAYQGNNKIGSEIIYSIGGGNIEIQGKPYEVKEVYPEKSFTDIRLLCEKNNWSLVDYVLHYEPDILEYLDLVFTTMSECINRGLTTTGLIPGKLKLERVAGAIYQDALHIEHDEYEHNKMLITSYAYAVGEENASGNIVVCAPTCGSSGVVPALLYFFYHDLHVAKSKILEALMVGGVFGNVVKSNATISGAKGGCQAEMGTACSMAASGIAYLLKEDTKRIEYAAEVAMEHHLGLTCDPVEGYVQIPCIERGGVAALRAYDAALFGKYIALHRTNRVSFDEVVSVMKVTGEHLRSEYRETALGGLAKEYKEKHRE